MQAETTLEQAWASPERSQDELIQEFKRLDALLKETGAERREVAMQLAGIAFANKGEQNTVHLQSTGGDKITVEFGIEYAYVTEELMEVARMLGEIDKELFDSIFKTSLEFVPKKRELKNFLNTVSSDERIETAKQMIKDATIVKNKAPYVSAK